MKRKTFSFVVITAALGCLSVTASAYRGLGRERHRSALEPLEAVLGAREKEQVRVFFMNDRTAFEILHQQVALARTALITKLLSPGKKVDLTKEIAQLKQAHDALIDERIKLALKVRTIMSPQELSEAFQLWTKSESLREQERSLFEEAEGRHASERQ